MLPNLVGGGFNQPLTQSKLIDQTKIQLGPNLADFDLGREQEKLLGDIYQYMLDRYITPQIMGRRPYEMIWDVLYDAYRMRLKVKDIKLTQDDTPFLQTLVERTQNTGGVDVNLTDTLIFDTVDRMANLTHFIMFKDDMSVQYNPARSKATQGEDRFYNPTERTYKSANALLEFFTSKSEVYDKCRIASKDYFLYGVCFICSHFLFQLEQTQTEVTLRDLDITFDPISIRKVWLNFMLSLREMGKQPCPFYYSYDSNFAILQNQYNPVMNPFGYVNLDKLDDRFYTAFAGMGEQKAIDAMKSRLESAGTTLNLTLGTNKDVAAHWTFYPMLPFDPETGEFKIRKDGKTPVPFRRFVWEQFGTDIIQSKVIPIRFQDASYYGDELPIYGATHLEDLDSAAYGMSICEALINYAIELSTCRNQYIENKNKINNPATWHTTGSPSFNQDVNKAGAKVEVLGPNDFGHMAYPDATGTTVAMCEHLRERAQTSSKAVDAIMGKAMGGRTSATEAQNVFQAAMSGVTTDINIYNYRTVGNFAKRVWKWSTMWLDIDLLKFITGNYGPELQPEDLNLNLSLKFDVGSSFIESIVKQQHIRYFLETGMRSPVIDQAKCFIMLADELRIKGLRDCVIPDGIDIGVEKAYDQAVKTYLGEIIMIDPTQDHQIAMEVKTRFLEDINSAWNVKYGALQYMNTPFSRAQALQQQIQIHQNFAMIQMMQQQQQEIANLQLQQSANQPPEGSGQPTPGSGPKAGGTMPSDRGQS